MVPVRYYKSLFFTAVICDRVNVKWNSKVLKKQSFGIMDQNQVKLTVRIWL